MTLPRSLSGLLAALLLGAAAATASAQSCGGCAAPPVGAGGAQRNWLEEGDWSLRVSGEWEVKDRTFKGRHGVANDFDETLRMWSARASLRYGLSDDWSAEMDVSEMEYRYRLKPPGGRRSEVVVRGPGDTVLRFGRIFDLGTRAAPATAGDPGNPLHIPGTAPPRLPAGTAPLPEDPVPTLSLWGGVSLPTGDVKKPDSGIVTRDFSVSNLQTGTGTFDPELRARVDVPLDGWWLYGLASASVPLVENRHGYRTAAAFTLGAGVERELAPGLRASLTTTWQHVGTDRFEGDRVAVGGGTWVRLAPALSLDLSDAATLDVAVRFPVFRDAATKIVDSDFVLQAGLTLRF